MLLMSKSRLWIIIVVVLLLVNTAVLAMLWFKRPPQDPPPGGGSAKDFLIKELSLTAEQEKKFDVLRDDHQSKTKAIMEGMKELKDALVDEISATGNDSSKINDLTKQIAEKERQRDLATVYHFRSFRTILNAEQQTKFDKILKQVMRMMGGQQKPQGPPPHGREKGDRPPRDSTEMPPPREEGGPEPH
jgi:Spy/CpxP family protein refolding chaperone